MALTPRERAVADIVENAAREAFPQLQAAGLNVEQTIAALRKLLPKVCAAAEEALGCLSPTGCGRNDQARHESEQGHLPNVSYRRETMCLRGLLLEALSLCVAVLSIGAGTGALPGPDAR